MRFSILALAAVASATPTLVERDVPTGLPTIQILPVPGYNSTDNSFNGLGALYTGNAASLTSQADSIAQANGGLYYNIGAGYNFDAKASAAKAIANVTSTFWSLAYESEKQVCALVTSINQQNVDTVRGQLRAGIIAEAQAVASIAASIRAMVTAIQTQILLFTATEKAVFAALIQAIIAAVTAAAAPASTLSAGLQAAGVTGISDVTQSLESAAAAAKAAATITWSY